MSQNLNPPPQGAMYLFDYITPPLQQGSYKIEASTRVTGGGINETLSNSRFFDVVGPRFALSPADLGGVFPPRNARGPFEGTLPHIAIKRRTLPWERRIDDALQRPANSGFPADYPVPWLALLLFQDGEYTLAEDVPLENAVPPTVFQGLGSPAGVRVTTVEADESLVRGLMPSIEELQLLTHVRWVNKDDRELSVEGSDGWFSVVMGNRLPTTGAKFRACLVSLEKRADLVPVNPPPSEKPPRLDIRFQPDNVVLQLDRDVIDTRALAAFTPSSLIGTTTRRGLVDYSGFVTDTELGRLVVAPKVKLVVLCSWQFTCEGEGTFRGLMQCLDVGMIGKPDKRNQPRITDTGHLRLKLLDRAGVEETVWYRGPLAPFELTRDPLGPYHSADQARRASPETGAEDISYASAFEVGRLLAAADGRLAQELMQWRRAAFRQSARQSVIETVEQSFALEASPDIITILHSAVTPMIAASVIEKVVQAGGPVVDPAELDKTGPVIGLDPIAVREAWNLNSEVEARALLGGQDGILGAEVPAPQFAPQVVESLDDLLAPGRLEHLEAERDLLIGNIASRLEEER
jgi:hypothetical protein